VQCPSGNGNCIVRANSSTLTAANTAEERCFADINFAILHDEGKIFANFNAEAAIVALLMIYENMCRFISSGGWYRHKYLLYVQKYLPVEDLNMIPIIKKAVFYQKTAFKQLLTNMKKLFC